MSFFCLLLAEEMQEFQKIFNKVQGKYVNYFTFKFGHYSVFNLSELFTKKSTSSHFQESNKREMK